jgi:uncharacterized protein involved in exopolysaccharide biosynthesis
MKQTLYRVMRTVVEAPLRRPWLVLWPAAGLAGAALLLSLLLPPRYRATALIRADWSGSGAAESWMAGTGAESRRLSEVRRRVLGQQVAAGGSPTKVEMDLDAATAVISFGSNVFAIAFDASDPATAALVANRLADLVVAEAERERKARLAADPVVTQARIAEARRVARVKEAELRRVPVVRETSVVREALEREYEEALRDAHKFLEQWRAAEVAARLGRAVVRFELAAPARIPDRPAFPNRSRFGFGGLVSGLALGLALAIVVEARDRSIKAPDELQELLGHPLLVVIPLVRSRSR